MVESGHRMDVHWSRRRDSNPEPAVYKTAALPIELRRRDGQGLTAEDPSAPGNDRAARRMGQAWGVRAGAVQRDAPPGGRPGALRGSLLRPVGREQVVVGRRPRSSAVAAGPALGWRLWRRGGRAWRPTRCGLRCWLWRRRLRSDGLRRRVAVCASALRSLGGASAGSARSRLPRRRSASAPAGSTSALRRRSAVGLGVQRPGRWRRRSASTTRPRGCGHAAAFGAAAVFGGLRAGLGRSRLVGRRRSQRRSCAARGVAFGSRWASASNSRIDPATAALSDPTAPFIGMRMNRSRAAADGRSQALALAADDDRQRPAQVALSGGHRGIALGAGDPDATSMEVAQRAGQVVDRAEQQVLDRAGRGLDGRRAERRLAVRREQHAVDAGRLGAAQERADVVRVLERVEHEDERRLVALGGAGEDVVQAGELARLDDERDALVAVEPGERGQRAAFDLDDRDAQVRRMQHELLEGGPALRARRGAGWRDDARRTPPRPGGGRRRAPRRGRAPPATAAPIGRGGPPRRGSNGGRRVRSIGARPRPVRSVSPGAATGRSRRTAGRPGGPPGRGP